MRLRITEELHFEPFEESKYLKMINLDHTAGQAIKCRQLIEMTSLARTNDKSGTAVDTWVHLEQIQMLPNPYIDSPLN